MASVLTSTSKDSSYLYLGLLLIASLTAVYLFLIKEPSIRDSLEKQAFFMNYSAFNNSIKLAHYRFLSDRMGRPLIDNWVEQETGLDFNDKGFPIGTDITDEYQLAPASAENCAQIWRFLMGPLRPILAINGQHGNYWVTLSTESKCVFGAKMVPNKQIIYDTSSGNVLFFTIND